MSRACDVVIAGGGLAGLSAAYHLANLDVLLLEQADRTGGRVLTRERRGIAYDLGALFAYDEAMAPFDLGPLDLVEEDAPIGILLDGALRLGRSVLECIEQAGLDAADLDTVRAFSTGGTGADALSSRARRVVNAFFKVIHPGEIDGYIPARQRDALVRFPVKHHRRRNEGLIGAYERRLHARVQLGAEVLSIEGRPDHVRVVYREGDGTHEVRSRAAVVSLPAPVARRVVRPLHRAATRFLEAVTYGRYTVAVFAVRRPALPAFTYAVTPDLPTCSLFQQRTDDADIRLLIAYFDDARSRELAGHDDACIADLARSSLARFPAASAPAGEILFVDVMRWDAAAPIVSPQAYADWDDACATAAAGVILAGDYVNPDFPYGMRAAVHSGARAARRLRELDEMTSVRPVAGERP